MVVAILQARMSSTRLPGKVLKPILGLPMLSRQLERLADVKQIDRLVVATSTDPSDDVIARLCAESNVACFRGSLANVLQRFYECATAYQATTVVRLTADCPLADPELIDRVIIRQRETGADYVSNSLRRTFPKGLDVEVFTRHALTTAFQEATTEAELEHVTPYIHAHPEQFTIVQFTQSQDQSLLRWTVDEPADYDFVCRVYESLYPRNPRFRTADIMHLLMEHPELSAVNAHVGRAPMLSDSPSAEAGR